QRNVLSSWKPSHSGPGGVVGAVAVVAPPALPTAISAVTTSAERTIRRVTRQPYALAVNAMEGGCSSSVKRSAGPPPRDSPATAPVLPGPGAGIGNHEHTA